MTFLFKQSSSLGYAIFAVGIGASSTSAACEMAVIIHTPLLCWFLPRARSSNLLYSCSTESQPEHQHLYVSQLVKNLPAVQEILVQSLVWEDPLEKGKAIPTPVFWPGECHGLYSPWGHKELNTAERLSLSCI